MITDDQVEASAVASSVLLLANALTSGALTAEAFDMAVAYLNEVKGQTDNNETPYAIIVLIKAIKEIYK